MSPWKTIGSAWVKFVKYGRTSNKTFAGRHAMAINTIISASLYAAGDGIQQYVEVKHGITPQFDWLRNFRVMIIGAIQSPAHVVFYKFLENKFPGRGAYSLTNKILIDQFLALPAFNTLYLMGLSLMEGKGLKKSWLELRRKFLIIYAADWIVWPPVQVINFYFLPVWARVSFINCLTVFWNIFLSYMKHYDQFDDRECCKLGTCKCRGPRYKGETGENQLLAFIRQIKEKHFDPEEEGDNDQSTDSTDKKAAAGAEKKDASPDKVKRQ